MAVKLTIQDLKHIKNLEFQIPIPGSYLLTGTNGAGKTSLLTCLSRLRNKNAFQKGFPSTSHQSLDSHIGASIKYEINGSNVTYTYVKERWSPLPRKNSGLLGDCGYPNVLFIAADASRILPQQDEFEPKKTKLVAKNIRDAMNDVFSSKKFDDLYFLNVSRGTGNKAYLIKMHVNGKNVYYSEKNFSLGELSVLKLLLALNEIQEDSLVLIDELELATHPRAQIALFKHLTRFSETKRLTVIFSTHSVTLIKNTNRKNILFLQNNAGNISCTNNCYPTYVLGHIASTEETSPDCIVYVEDDSARKCFAAMYEMYKINRTKSGSNATQIPTTIIIPLGGFTQILDFLDTAPRTLPTSTKLVALLDKDVENESLENYKSNEDYARLGLFKRLDKKIKYLPWTPEVGLLQLIQEDRNKHEQQLKTYFCDPRISISDIPTVNFQLSGRKLRDSCKEATYKITENLSSVLGKSRDSVREALFTYLVKHSPEESIIEIVSGCVY